MCKLGGRDHNATSYSTETHRPIKVKTTLARRDHNATSYSTETKVSLVSLCALRAAEIITLRAIALKHTGGSAEDAVIEPQRSKGYKL